MNKWFWWTIDGTRGLYSKAHLFREMRDYDGKNTAYGVTMCGRTVYPQICSGFVDANDEYSQKHKPRCATCARITKPRH